jgi:hypothetical protein
MTGPSIRTSIANESASQENLGAERELEVVLDQYASTAHKIASLQALVDAGTFSAALFTQLDLENARRDELGERKAALESKVETARAKDASLHTTSPHILGSWVDFDTISCIRRSIFIDFGESNGL